MEANTVVLERAEYDRLMEMERNQEKIKNITRYGPFGFNESYSYSGPSEVIANLVKENDELHTRIQDLLHPPIAPKAQELPITLIQTKLREMSRKQRRRFIRTGEIE